MKDPIGVDLDYSAEHDCKKTIARIFAMLEQQSERMNRLEKTVADRNEEMYALLRDQAITTSHFSSYTDRLEHIEDEYKQSQDEHKKLREEISAAMQVFKAARWFITTVIPMLVGIFLMQIFKLDGMPWGS